MRSTQDLIDEMDKETATRQYLDVAIVVGFKDSTTFILGSDADRLKKLNQAVTDGGEPVGILALRGSGNGAVLARSFPEYAGDSQITQYLQTLAATFAATLEARGLGKPAEPAN